jgi:hypothetical protein
MTILKEGRKIDERYAALVTTDKKIKEKRLKTGMKTEEGKSVKR